MLHSWEKKGIDVCVLIGQAFQNVLLNKQAHKSKEQRVYLVGCVWCKKGGWGDRVYIPIKLHLQKDWKGKQELWKCIPTSSGAVSVVGKEKVRFGLPNPSLPFWFLNDVKTLSENIQMNEMKSN